MFKVECPLCSETVDLGSDSTGIYECPYCNEDFEFEREVSEDLVDLIHQIQEGKEECFVVYDHSHPPKITLLFALACILTSFLVMPLLVFIERVIYQFEEKYHRQIVFLHATYTLISYTISESGISYFNELDLSEEFTITSEYDPGSDGGMISSSNEITIRDKNGNEIRFQDPEHRSNIIPFAKLMNCDIEGIGPYRYHKGSIEFKFNPEGRIGLY